MRARRACSRLFAKSGDRAGKITRLERLQIALLFAHAYIMRRQFETVGDRHQYAAARGSIEFCHHQAGDASNLAEDLDLIEGVLADSRVENEKHRVRRVRIDLLHDSYDFFKFGHEFDAILQPAGGVHQQHIRPAGARFCDGVERETRRIRSLRAGDHRRADARPPDLQLLDGGGPECVARREHNLSTLAGKSRRELADGGGFARPVDAHDEDHKWLPAWVDVERQRDRSEGFLDFSRENRLDLGRLDLAIVSALANRLADAARGGDAQVRLNQNILQLVQHGGVEFAFGENRRNALANRRGRAREAVAQAPPPRALRVRRAGGGFTWRRWRDIRQIPLAAKNPAQKAGFFGVTGRQFVVHARIPAGRMRGAAIVDTLSHMTSEEILARLLYRDALMLVIDKPAGIAVHQGPKGGDNLEAHFDALRFGLPRTPALAHRLDRDTSGCLVLGRHRKALETLGKLFKNGAISKTYWAVVEGMPPGEGLIDMPLGRLDAKRGWWMKVDPLGAPSQTRWRVLGRSQDPEGRPLAWLALEPLTGRTHQLRVHCASMGWPILGDPIYGAAPREGGPGLQLHARRIVVPLYKNKPAIEVEAAPPEAMGGWLAQCGTPEGVAQDLKSTFVSPAQ